MLIWVWGRNKTREAYQSFAGSVTIGHLVDLYNRVWGSPRGVLEDEHGRFVGTGRAVMVLSPAVVDSMASVEPPALRSCLRQNGAMPAYIMFLTVNEAPVPYIEGNRYTRIPLLEDRIFSVAVEKGFMEDLPIPKILLGLEALGLLPIPKEGWEAVVGDEVITVTKDCSFLTRKLAAAYAFIRRLALPAYTYFGVVKQYSNII
jgi:K+ transporter